MTSVGSTRWPTTEGWIVEILDIVADQKSDDCLTNNVYGLSAPQLRLARVLARGFDRPDVLAYLKIDAATLDRQLQQIFDKLRASNLAHAQHIISTLGGDLAPEIAYLDDSTPVLSVVRSSGHFDQDDVVFGA